jgi:hypothetical protein
MAPRRDDGQAQRNRGFGWLIRDGAGWVVTYEGADQLGTLPGHLLRVDLAGGQATTWLSTPSRHQYYQLIGIDGTGAPLVTLEDADAQTSTLLRVTAPGQTEQIFSGPLRAQFTTAVTDRNGTWLAGGSGQVASQGIYLLTESSEIRKVSDFGGLPLGPSQ